MEELSDFQREVLYHLPHIDKQYGLAIKDALEEYYEAPVNHGRLYPNLNDMVEMGYITKSEMDKRTNEYNLTKKGREAIRSQRDRLDEAIRLADENAENAEYA